MPSFKITKMWLRGLLFNEYPISKAFPIFMALKDKHLSADDTTLQLQLLPQTAFNEALLKEEVRKSLQLSRR